MQNLEKIGGEIEVACYREGATADIQRQNKGCRRGNFNACVKHPLNCRNFLTQDVPSTTSHLPVQTRIEEVVIDHHIDSAVTMKYEQT